MEKTKTTYSQFREKYADYQQYSEIAQRVQKNEVVPGIHNFAADILKKKGLEDLADDLIRSPTRPDNHALIGIIGEGVVLSQKAFNDFGKNHLVGIVNSKDLKRETVAQALLMLPPEKDVPGYEPLSDIHKDASEFYRDLYFYQQNGKISDEQKAGLKHNMKVRVLKHYQESFKNDEPFFGRLAAFVQGYEDIAIAQYKRFTETKVKEFSDKLNASNAGAYVKAMSLSDEKRDMFYQTILQ